MLARSRHQRPPRPRAPVPAPPFPRPSRPQPRTPQPRWSRRHSGSRRRRQPQVAAIPSKNAIYRPAISSKKLAKGRHGPAGLAPIAEGDNIGIDAADDEDADRERRDEVRGPPPLGVAHVVVRSSASGRPPRTRPGANLVSHEPTARPPPRQRQH